jgi:hypothetical protein
LLGSVNTEETVIYCRIIIHMGLTFIFCHGIILVLAEKVHI